MIHFIATDYHWLMAWGALVVLGLLFNFNASKHRDRYIATLQNHERHRSLGILEPLTVPLPEVHSMETFYLQWQAGAEPKRDISPRLPI